MIKVLGPETVEIKKTVVQNKSKYPWNDMGVGEQFVVLLKIGDQINNKDAVSELSFRSLVSRRNRMYKAKGLTVQFKTRLCEHPRSGKPAMVCYRVK